MALAYSPISAIDRIIEPCPQFDKYFDKPKTGELKRKMIASDADVEQTVDLMLDVINKHYKEVERAKHLVKGANNYQTAKKIFDFIYNHIKYNLEPGEILHTPAAVYWHGQVMARQNPNHTDKYPIDCDDMAIMACSFLKALHLPWSLRIASYDGIKFGHVYCVVPQRDKEVIIDPVYIGFNKEKPYKMQKTFVGSTEGMAGIPVYLQSVNGLAGIGNPETVGLLTGILSGSHFSGIQAIGNEDRALLGYLKDTLKLARKRPDLVKHKSPYMFQKMLDRAIKGLNTNEEEDILNILAEQEQQFIDEAKAMSGFEGDNDWYYDENPDDQELSGLSYRTMNGDRYFNVGNLGFFGRLKLLSKLKGKMKEKIQARKQASIPANIPVKTVNKGSRMIKMLNKANPLIQKLKERKELKAAPEVKPIVIAPSGNSSVQRAIQEAIQLKPSVIVAKPQEMTTPTMVDDEQQYSFEENYETETEPENDTYADDTDMDYSQDYEAEEPESESDETDEIIEGLAGGIHFAGTLGETDPNIPIKRYLKDTLKVARRRPGMVRSMYRNPERFKQMCQKAIAGLEGDEESDILDILAEQEQAELNKPLSGLESDLYYLDGIGTIDFGGLGLFGRLGLFKKLKQKHRTKKIARLERKGKTAKLEKFKKKIVKRDARAEKRKKIFQNVARMFNKVNPITIAARNGLRLLVAINFFGLASKLKAEPEVAKKVKDLFRKMGGNVSKIEKSIENGSKKKPLLKKTGSVKVNESVEGFGIPGAGAAASFSLDFLLKSAGKIVEKIMTWFKNKKAAIMEKRAIRNGEAPPESSSVPMDESTMPDPNEPGNTATPEKPKFFKRVVNFAKDQIKQNPGILPFNLNQNQQQNQQNSEGEQSLLPVSQERTAPETAILPISQNTTKTAALGGSKTILWAAGIAGVAALAYFATTRPKPTELSGYKKLSGIKLK
jgi:hypothetical protein